MKKTKFLGFYCLRTDVEEKFKTAPHNKYLKSLGKSECGFIWVSWPETPSQSSSSLRLLK